MQTEYQSFLDSRSCGKGLVSLLYLSLLLDTGRLKVKKIYTHKNKKAYIKYAVIQHTITWVYLSFRAMSKMVDRQSQDTISQNI